MRGANARAVVAAALALGVALAGAAPARAEEAPPRDPPASQPAAAKPDYGHRLQGGVGVIIGSGYRGIVRYHGKPGACEDVADSDKTFCHSRLPTWMDLEGSFGVTKGLVAIVDFRVGFEKDFTHSRPLVLAPGIKYFIDAQDRLKFFITLQLAIDFTGQLPDVPRTDVGIRNAVGLQFDVHRVFGFWLQLGDTLAFRRYFRFELDAAVGLEVRFPP
jgi:hypothetical protein